MPPAVLPPSLFSRRALLRSPAEHHPLGWGGAELWAGSGRFWCDGPAAAPVSGRRRPEEYRGPAGEGGPSQGILPPSPGPSGQVRDLCLVPLLQAQLLQIRKTFLLQDFHLGASGGFSLN